MVDSVFIIPLFVIALLAGVNNAAAQVTPHACEYSKLVVPSAALEVAGIAVATDGQIVVVGAPGYLGYSDTGSVFVYRRNGARLIFEAELTAFGGVDNDGFGTSVAVSGDRIIVGAPYPLETTGGAVYVFKWNGSNWAPKQKLENPMVDPMFGDEFGRSVAIGVPWLIDHIIVGAPGYANGSGVVVSYFWTIDHWESGWFRIGQGSANPDIRLGTSVSTSNDWGVFSVPGYQRVQVFDSSFTNVATLEPTGVELDDHFGSSVSTSGDVVVVGAHGDDDRGQDAGAIYVLRRRSDHWDENDFVKLLASDGVGGDRFGVSVSVSDDVIVVGTNGAVDFAGAVYVFRWNGSSWIEEQKLLASDGSASDSLGLAVAIGGKTVVVGAPFDNANGFESGSAYIFGAPAHVATLSVPGDLPTIQEAIDCATDGTTILVAAGHYTGPDNRGLQFRGKDITLESVDGPEATTIDAEGFGSCFILDDECRVSSARIEGFTITGGSASFGGGIRCEQAGSLEVVSCTFQDNDASGNGAALLNELASLNVENCVFSFNTANGDGGAIWHGADEPVDISGCVFLANTARHGGAIWIADSNTVATVFNCMFNENSVFDAAGDGGAILNGTGSIEISHSQFNSNYALNGGAVYTDGDTMLSNCSFDDNRATDGGFGGFMTGGALRSSGAVVDVRECSFYGNLSLSGEGGAWYASVPAPGSIAVDCTFGNNNALSGGGAIRKLNGELEMINCLFTGNASLSGGGGLGNTGIGQITNCTFSLNSLFPSFGGHGGGIGGSSTGLTITNSVFWGNSDSSGTSETSQIVLSEEVEQYPVVNYSCIQNAVQLILHGMNNQSFDPQFVDADGMDNEAGTADDDLHLFGGSNSINAGDESVLTVSTDLDGNPRITGLTVDLGVYESGFVQPDGDECATAILASDGIWNHTTDDNTGLTDDTTCGADDAIDQWYVYTATCTGLLQVSTCFPDTEFDTTLAIFSACNGTELACNDDVGASAFDACDLYEFGGLKSRVGSAVEAGQVYFVRISGSEFASGGFTISFTCLDPTGDMYYGPSGDWFDSVNWGMGVPFFGLDVVIPTGVAIGGSGFAGAVAEAGVVDIADGGGLDFNGGSLLAEQVNVAAGGYIAGAGSITADSVDNAGLLVAGELGDSNSIAIFSIAGDYIQQSSGELEIRLAGNVPGVSHSVLAVTENATLAGTLRLTCADGFVPERGATFEVLTAQTISGAFDAIESTGLPADLFYRVSYDDGAVRVSVNRMQRVPSDQATIQAAVDVSIHGDLVLIEDGVYTGPQNKNITFYGRDIELRSENGALTTIIDCDGDGRAFNFSNTPAAVIEGLTIRNAQNPFGGVGGAIALVNSAPTIRACVIEGGMNPGSGGAIGCVNSSPTIVDCVIKGNRGVLGGAIYASGASSPNLVGCTVTGNFASSGGGIYVQSGAQVSLERTVLWGNCAGSGAQAYVSGSALSFTCCVVDANGVSGSGTIEYLGDNVLTSPLFVDPAPCESAPTTGGDYMVLLGSPCLAENNACGEVIGRVELVVRVPEDAATIQAAIDAAHSDSSVRVGVGVWMGSGNKNLTFGGKSIHLRSANGAETTIIDCGFDGRAFNLNGANGVEIEGFTLRNAVNPFGGVGGAIALVNSSPTIRACVIHGNMNPGNGGALGCIGSSPTIVDCVFTGNRGANGGAIYATGDSAPQLVGCTVAGNRASSAGGGMYLASTAMLSAERSIFVGNCAGSGNEGFVADATSTVSFTCCDVSVDGIGGPGVVIYAADNTTESPQFCSPMSCDDAPSIDGDYRLESGSPCLPQSSPCSLLIGALGACPSVCLADIDGGGTVGFADLLAVLSVWGTCPACPEDLDGSGDVGFSDLLMVLSAWGPCP